MISSVRMLGALQSSVVSKLSVSDDRSIREIKSASFFNLVIEKIIRIQNQSTASNDFYMSPTESGWRNKFLNSY